VAYLPIEIIKTIRPVHWVKNLAVFAALLFSGNLFEIKLLIQLFWVFWAFNLAASATYVFNDLLDAKADRLHPIKKNRPLAKKTLSPSLALITSALLALSSLILGYLISNMLFYLLLGYLLLQATYSLFLKTMPIVDILVIATGFVIRVYTGAFVIDAHLSVWFLLCVISFALFLASGKRRAELGTIGDSRTRKSLKRYPQELLNSYVTMFGNAAWLSWSLFTFFESPKAALPVWLFLAELSRATTINKLLMITIPVVIFGVMRYESLIFQDKSEAPEKLLLTDKALMASVAIWAIMIIWILYGGVSIQGA
jgi:decaprenyl-phosphate phosphoribosyltransferase